jgi:hypothetical protein
MTTAPVPGGRSHRQPDRFVTVRLLADCDLAAALAEVSVRVEAASTLLADAVVLDTIDLTDAALGAITLLERARLYLRVLGTSERRNVA